MKNGTCVKCGKDTVHALENGVGGSGGLHVLSEPSRFIAKMIYMNVMSYVCVSCGYFENHFTEKDKLSDIAQKWRKAK